MKKLTYFFLILIVYFTSFSKLPVLSVPLKFLKMEWDMECTGHRKMKPSVHDSLATAARAYFMLQWLVFVASSHWEGRNVCSYWWKTKYTKG